MRLISGGTIAGRKLLYWSETIDLVQRAHAAFPDRVIIGWDVAILADGPCLVEGNGGPDLDIHLIVRDFVQRFSAVQNFLIDLLISEAPIINVFSYAIISVADNTIFEFLRCNDSFDELFCYPDFFFH